MTPEPCVQWRGALALHAFDALDDHERTSLVAHVEGCESCRDVLRELTDVAEVLGHLEPTSLQPTASVPPELASRVLGDLRDVARRHRVRRHVVVTGVAAALIAAASVGAWLAVATPAPAPGAATRTVALSGPHGVTARALLTARPWGTAITLTEQGLEADDTYVVSLRSSSGSWWAVGTYRAINGRTVTAQLTCAVPMGEVAGIEVRDADGGRTVLHGGHLGTGGWLH